MRIGFVMTPWRGFSPRTRAEPLLRAKAAPFGLNFVPVIWVVFSALISAVLYPGPAVAQPEQSRVAWRTLAPDLEVAERSLSPGILSSPIVLVRSALKTHRLGVIRATEFGMRRGEVKTLCRLSKASVCINANFFDELGDPLGVVMSRGILHRRIHSGGRTLTGIIQATRQGVDIIPRQSFTSSAVLDAIQAGPRLVVDGARSPDIRDLTRTGRSAVCLDQKGRLIFLASSAGFRGLTFTELQDLLLDENVACKVALNLDGGGSSQLFVAPPASAHSTTAEAISLNGFDQVPVALALFDDKE